MINCEDISFINGGIKMDIIGMEFSEVALYITLVVLLVISLALGINDYYTIMDSSIMSLAKYSLLFASGLSLALVFYDRTVTRAEMHLLAGMAIVYSVFYNWIGFGELKQAGFVILVILVISTIYALIKNLRD